MRCARCARWRRCADDNDRRLAAAGCAARLAGAAASGAAQQALTCSPAYSPPTLRRARSHIALDPLVRRRLPASTWPRLRQAGPARAYATFNDFFTRALKPGARPIADADLVCPVDGAISQFGAIDGDPIFQAKGHSYTVHRTGRRRRRARAHVPRRPLRHPLPEPEGLPPHPHAVRRPPHAHDPRARRPVLGQPDHRARRAGPVRAQRARGLRVRPARTALGCWCWSAPPSSAAWPPSGTASSTRRARRRCAIGATTTRRSCSKQGEEMGRFLLGSTVVLLFRAARASSSRPAGGRASRSAWGRRWRAAAAAPLRRRRNAQQLPRIDLVRVLEHRLVGLEDHRVLVGVAVELLGDLRQVVAADDRMPLRSGCGVSTVSMSLTLATPATLPQHSSTFSLRRLVGHGACDGDGRRRRVEAHVQAAHVAGPAWRCTRRSPYRPPRSAPPRSPASAPTAPRPRPPWPPAAEQFLAGFLDEGHQTHGACSLVVSGRSTSACPGERDTRGASRAGAQ